MIMASATKELEIIQFVIAGSNVVDLVARFAANSALFLITLNNCLSDRLWQSTLLFGIAAAKNHRKPDPNRFLNINLLIAPILVTSTGIADKFGFLATNLGTIEFGFDDRLVTI